MNLEEVSQLATVISVMKNVQNSNNLPKESARGFTSKIAEFEKRFVEAVLLLDLSTPTKTRKPILSVITDGYYQTKQNASKEILYNPPETEVSSKIFLEKTKDKIMEANGEPVVEETKNARNSRQIYQADPEAALLLAAEKEKIKTRKNAKTK